MHYPRTEHSVRLPQRIRTIVCVAGLIAVLAAPSSAQERLCDNSFEDCRASILTLIRAERVGIDVSFWFMTDWRYSSEIIARWRAGVPVRILLDLRSDAAYPAAASIRQNFIDAGIPIRHKTTTGINHWKMILYAGQGTMHFSAGNFANGSYSPITPYTSYVDEAVYFTDDPAVVDSFMTKYDDLWTNTYHYANLANVSTLVRNYPTYPIDAALNFPPDEDYQDRLVAAMRTETAGIDVVMFRITSGKVPDEMIRRAQAGVPTRLVTDRHQYRSTSYFWHAYNVDRMFVAGIPIKWKLEPTIQDVHQKSVVLYGRAMVVFGSSNWTSSSSDTQREHNYFTSKTWFVEWFAAQFLRKWDNRKIDGSAITPVMFETFTPGWPDAPIYSAPTNGSANIEESITLRWEGGWWAHKYDVHFGTTNPPPLVAADFMPGSATAGVSSSKESFNPCAPPAPFVSSCPSGLAPGTTYYWMVRSKTMVGNLRRISGPVWSFTTAGATPPPTTNAIEPLADAYVRGGQYAATNYGTAAELVAKYSSDPQYRRESFLKFDIGDIQTGDVVRLRVFSWLSDLREARMVIAVTQATDTNWIEAAITFNNRPASGTTEWGRVYVSSTTGRWYEVDLTQRVQAERAAGRQFITLVLKKSTDTLPLAAFGSRESANPPVLTIGGTP
jgi:phosphatidylserine/phosphatidylglycerophosphate/cardiolipin synthase-like enzyme